MPIHAAARSRSGAGALAALGLALLPRGAGAEARSPATATTSEGGAIVIHPVEHASFVMTTPGLVIYDDPVGGAGPTPACRRPA